MVIRDTLMGDNPYRGIPPVNDVLDVPGVQALAELHAHDAIVTAVRTELDELRRLVKQGEPLDGAVNAAAVGARVAARLARDLRPKLRSVINATGIVLH